VFWVRLKERHVLNLNRIIDVASKTEGVVGVFLFGSLARGDFDEFSDYDLLVVFADKAVMWQSWDALFEAMGSLRLNLHVIPETLEELKSANPVFLNDLSRHGKVLFAKFPLEVFSMPVRLDPFCLIVYDMSRLSYSDKMKVVYFLFRKGGQGTVAQMGGVKLSEGCLLVPRSACDEIASKLKGFGIAPRKLEAYISQDYVKQQFSSHV